MAGSADVAADSTAGRSGWWQCLALSPTRAWDYFALVWSDRYPDGTRVELSAEAARAQIAGDAVCVARYDEVHKVTALEVGRRIAPAAPPLWFFELRESTARPPAVNLMAFTGHGVAAGTLLDEHDIRAVGVRTDDQLGAIRWWPATGEVDQVYVTPTWRRQRVGMAVIGAGSTLSLARGWPRYWGDGQRTELGEKLRAASPCAHRGAELTHIAPPMTPGDKGG
jgi:hypothetical protein